MRLIVENNIATLEEGDITVASHDLKGIIDHIKKDKLKIYLTYFSKKI